MSIRLLPPEVVAQIAAGEVIERPASVVKELVENALDAGARSVSVSIEAAGRERIQVVDDGAGIPADEIALAVSRHATSKLRRAEDLFHISSLGFRGEALAAIGAVSRLTITSKVAGAASGARIQVEGGHAGRVETVGAPSGTVVRVENLFYNVPARRKFLKADLTERRAIDTLVTRYALAYPQVRFRLSEGERLTFQTAGDGDRRAILASLYGVETAKQLLELQAEEEGIQVRGFISPSNLTRSNRKEITFFINGRWIQDVPLTSVLLQAYHALLMVGRYPLATLFIEIAPQEVDVNVHPAKAEVRFRNAERVLGFVQRAVRRALLAYSPLPAIPASVWGARPQAPNLDWQVAHAEAAQATAAPPGAGAGEAGTHPPWPAAPRMPLLRLVGQIGAAYLVAEGPDGLYLIDQHAAHERVLFEKLMIQHAMRHVPSQALLTPAVVQLPPASAQLLSEQLPLLQRLGFEVEAFGANTFQVRAVPSLFAHSDPSLALRAVVEDFEEDERPLQDEVEKRLAARVCKRLAVRAGQTLSAEEQRALLTDLERCEAPRTCPHGRPTMIHLSVEVLERQFGRRGAR